MSEPGARFRIRMDCVSFFLCCWQQQYLNVEPNTQGSVLDRFRSWTPKGDWSVWIQRAKNSDSSVGALGMAFAIVGASHSPQKASRALRAFPLPSMYFPAWAINRLVCPLQMILLLDVREQDASPSSRTHARGTTAPGFHLPTGHSRPGWKKRTMLGLVFGCCSFVIGLEISWSFVGGDLWNDVSSETLYCF